MSKNERTWDECRKLSEKYRCPICPNHVPNVTSKTLERSLKSNLINQHNKSQEHKNNMLSHSLAGSDDSDELGNAMKVVGKKIKNIDDYNRAMIYLSTIKQRILEDEKYDKLLSQI